MELGEVAPPSYSRHDDGQPSEGDAAAASPPTKGLLETATPSDHVDVEAPEPPPAAVSAPPRQRLAQASPTKASPFPGWLERYSENSRVFAYRRFGRVGESIVIGMHILLMLLALLVTLGIGGGLVVACVMLVFKIIASIGGGASWLLFGP